MNYFGHAAVASWTPGPPGVVLGAMLPDFASMCGGQLDGADDAEVAHGIELHHAADRVFHQMPAVLGLMRELDGLLAGEACARGPRRAVAHIGVELLLDGVLVRTPAYRAAYLAAIDVGEPRLRWREPGTAPRFAVLMARLQGHGVPDDLQRPESVVARLQRTLAPRPLLAPSPDDVRAIRAAVTGFAPRLEVACETVLRGMRAGLA
ncbi:MAG TPA: hypothetical protein VGC42_16115 [Kofleriaceae bacterium]